MRESQMKKIIAAAVATAFVAPAFAADITISGDQEFSWQDNNGVTTAELDGDFNIKASTETANGLSVAADINVSEIAANDGSASLTIGGPFGKIDMGDTSSALDAVDDVTDWGYELTTGTGNEDASVLWTLPSLAEGLTVNLSFSADSTSSDSGIAAGNGYSAKYAIGDGSIRYGVGDFEDGSESTYVAATYSVAGIGLAAEQYTTTTAAGVDTDNDAIGVTYSSGDITLAIETLETSSAGTVSADITTLGFHYSMGGGLTAFVEQKDDDKTPSAETTAVGLAFKF
jgi:hypothetical protein